jgi:Tfp pilus assembly protein FimT
MITVLSIIIIVLAIAIPVWDAMMNGTNLSAAQNQISAYLANARADAVYNHQTIGVCFYIDPKTTQTGMAEVQVQTLYQPTTKTYTFLFQPSVNGAATPNNGFVSSLELVNNPDPANAGNYIFYRDSLLLPKGVSVALNNNTYNYNAYNLYAPPAGGPWFDRYVRVGVILFNPDGTLASIPYGIPLNENFTSTAPQKNESQLCLKIGMSYSGTADFGSNVSPSAGPPAVNYPLYSSVGLVIYDHDAYLNQHATPTSTVPGDSAPFTDADMNYPLMTPEVSANISYPIPADKYLEEAWIDSNGIAFLVSPFNGSLIKAK